MRKIPKILLPWLVLLFFLVGCSGINQSHMKKVPSKNLLVDISSFPEGWQDTGCTTLLCRKSGGVTAARNRYFNPSAAGSAYEEVFRFPDEKGASKKFAVYRNGNFNPSPVRSPFVPFVPPEDITFKSKIADEYYLACGMDVISECSMLARYDNYFVYFFFAHWISENPEGLTSSEIQKVLEDLEEKVSKELNLEN
jgi:hypothetical protein